MDQMTDGTFATGGRVFDDRVRERDLDHFLIEELQASSPSMSA